MQVTDGGIETDLIFRRGRDLPHFAAFPLLDTADGRRVLGEYYLDYAGIARAAGAALLLETPTWRASPDWGAHVGYDAAALTRVNTDAVAFLRRLGSATDLDDVQVSGTLGPRGDGYLPGQPADADEAALYHDAQVRAFAVAGADLVTAMTIIDTAEAIGVVRAARAHGLPVAISFTVETDGRLPDGRPLQHAVEAVDAAAAPDHFLVNCAHPDHVLRALDPGGPWLERIRGLRCNASRLSHAELDAADDLDDGDPAAFAAEHDVLRALLPGLSVLGGCCGTDARHVAALWGVPAHP